MIKKLTLVLALAAFIAAPASAAVQNFTLSGSLNSTFLYRTNFEFGENNVCSGENSGGCEKEDQRVFITQATLKAAADLTDQVSVVIGLINERPWEASTSNTATDVDLYLAYVTLREMLYSPLTVIIGRQQWGYGNNFIFHSAGTNNAANGDSGISSVAKDLTMQTSLDAIRFILDYSPLKIEGFYAAVSPRNSGDAGLDDDSVNLWGLVGTYELGDDMNSVVEAYLFDKKDKSGDTTTVDHAMDHLKVLGGRVSTNPLDAVHVSLEVAHQSGTKRLSAFDQERDAWGFQGISSYKLPLMEEYSPVLQYVYTKVYGHSGSAATDPDDTYTAWDPFYENQAGGTIYNSLFNLSNAVIHTASLSFNPMEDVKTTISGTKLWMHQPLVAGDQISLVQPDAANQVVDAKSGQRELGVELDMVTTYDYTEDVQFGLNLGLFKPGDAFDDENREVAKQALVNVNVNF